MASQLDKPHTAAEVRSISPRRTDEDLNYEVNLRPRGFEDYVGQEQVKNNLKVAITAARGRQDVLDHLLFHGPPGLGKTSLAYIISREMGVAIKATSATGRGSGGVRTGLLPATPPGRRRARYPDVGGRAAGAWVRS